MGQHEKWIQNMFAKQMKDTASNKSKKVSVFDKLKLNQMYVDLKKKMIKEIHSEEGL